MLYECPQCHAECTADLTKDPTVKCPSCGFSLSTARRADSHPAPPHDELPPTTAPQNDVAPAVPTTVNLEEATPVADLSVKTSDREDQDRTVEPATSASELAAPLRWIGRYRIERYVASGSFGDVYQAVDAKLSRTVAIKVPRRAKFPSDERYQKFLRSFEEEGRRAAQLNHPGIVQTYDVEFDEPTHTSYIVMEYVDGGPLDKRLRADHPTLTVVVDWLAQVADAVHYAHKQGFVHRDLKPSNILIDSSGRARVVDFGLALHEDEQRRHRGQVAGTLAYMSPEQVLGRTEHLDGRTDVWSLGAIMYRALTGRVPFTGSDTEQREQILEREPKPFSQINDSLPRELEQICVRGCLVKSVAERMPSARDLRDALRAWLDAQRAVGSAGAVAIDSPGSRDQDAASTATLSAGSSTLAPSAPQTDSRRRWLRRAAVATAAVLGVPVGVYAIVHRRRSSHPFADRFFDIPDIDRLATENVPFDVLRQRPIEIMWPKNELRSWAWNPESRSLSLPSNDQSLCALGRTARDAFRFEIEFDKQAWTGVSGVFVGLAPVAAMTEDDAGLSSGIAMINGPWHLQTVALHSLNPTEHRVERNYVKFRLSDTGFDSESSYEFRTAAVKVPDKSPTLEFEVRNGQILEMSFNRNLLRSMNEDIASDGGAARVCRGIFGVLNHAGSVVIRRATFTAIRT